MQSKLEFGWDQIFNPHRADAQGLVAVGGEWGSEILWQAYQRGVFPWPQEDLPILWFSPDPRGILEFHQLHVGKTTRKLWKHHPWKITINQAFDQVMQACAKTKRPGQEGTWILPPMLEPYSALQAQGRALSLEVWNSRDELVGGIYGVRAEFYFSAESMFYKESGASKVAVIALVQYLKEQEGLTWMDIQMLTPVTESLGGHYCTRAEFLKRIGLGAKSL